MLTRTQAIKEFLKSNTCPDLAAMYNHDMECQVNVAQDDGERIEGEYLGKKWNGWTDNIETWKSFRIPYNAMSEPEYTDTLIKFNLSKHAEGIGMTGWDWANRLSRWVAFDFDAITGHSDKNTNKLTSEELIEVQTNATKIPWIMVRRSTSGKGLHLYVFLEPVETKNHTEHAALARAILGQMSMLTGFDFNSRIDVCGGNMWVWHRKMRDTLGLTIIKNNDTRYTAPPNWREHIDVILRKSKKTSPSRVIDQGSFDTLEEQQSHFKLDSGHLKLIKYLTECGAQCWWDQDRHMLVAHTADLKEAHTSLGLKGVFDTVATGKDRPDHNCFMFPLRRGAWAVRRFGLGTSEHVSWEQDGQGWTKCYFNQEPNLSVAARACGGVEDEGHKFVFRYAENAIQAAQILGVDFDLKPPYMLRRTILKYHKDNQRLVCEIDRSSNDDRPDDWKDWVQTKTTWKRIFNSNIGQVAEPDVENYDDVVRHLVSVEGTNRGWAVKTADKWHDEPLTHIRNALSSLGHKSVDINVILGNSVFKPWYIVSKPFGPEYPGNRQWNRGGAQLTYVPDPTKEKLSYPTWLSILNHIGESINDEVYQHPWCKSNGILTGGDYLKCWVASMFQEPDQPLPYLFLYGPQQSGKSVFHESLQLLFATKTGVMEADKAITNPQGFNFELENAVLCYIEETSLRKNNMAYNRIKNWVTSPRIQIHPKGETPYMAPNMTHWVQCSNEESSCPVFPGDTRVTMIYVDNLSNPIPRKEFFSRLEKEAPDFVTEIFRMELPLSEERLNIPVVENADKRRALNANKTLLELFLDEECFFVPGEIITISEFHEKFHSWLEPVDRPMWSKIKISREMPKQFPRGRRSDAKWCYGNLSFENKKSLRPPLKVVEDKLL